MVLTGKGQAIAQVVTELSLLRSRINPRIVDVGFVVDKLALGQVSVETGHAAHCTCAAACAMATGRIPILLMTQKCRLQKKTITRVTGIDNKIACCPVNNHTVYEIYLRN
jgi:hypothetical protein